MSAALSHRLVTSAQTGSVIAAALSAAVGVVVLLGWALNVDPLKSIVPGAATMKVNTALAFLLAGVALGLLHPAAPAGPWQRLGRGCAGLVALIGFLSLVEYALGWRLGIDELFIRDDTPNAGPFPGRPAVITALSFVLIGLALWLLGRARGQRLAQFLAVASGLGALLALIGYLYGAEAFYRLTGSYAMALHTAVGLFVLALGVLLARPAHGWMALVVSAGAGGTWARRLLPAAVIVPAVVGWLRLVGQNAGLYDTQFGLALFATANIIVFSSLIAAAASSLYRTDLARQAAEQKIIRLNADLEQRVQARTAELTRANAQLAQEAAERQQAARELSRLKLALDQMAEGAQIISHEWRYLYLNDAAARQGQHTKAELLGRTMPEMYPGVERTPLFAAMQRCLAEQTAAHLENEFTFPDQTTGWYDLSLQPMADGLFILSTDISERKRAEAALRASEAKQRALFAALPVGVSVLDQHRRVVETNPALGRILRLTPEGQAAEAYAGRSYQRPDGTRLAPEDLPSARAFETQQAVLDVEIGVVIETGETVWTSVSAAPLTGTSLGAVVVTSDITARKQAEAALAHERDLLQALLDNLPDLIYFKDTASRFTRINQAQARLLGVRAPEEAYGKTDVDFQAPHLAAAFAAEEQLLFQTGRPILDRQEFNPTPDGRDRWFAATKMPLTDRHGRVQGLIGISHDITQRIAAAEGLRQANAALTERVQQMALLHALDEQLQACLTMPEVYQVTANLAGQLFPTVSGALYITSSTGHWLETASSWGAAPPAAPVFGREDCWAIRRGQTYVAGPSHPTHTACRHLPSPPPALAVCIPILAQGETLGLLQFSSTPGAAAPPFDDSLLQLTRVVADSVALALANLSLREKLRQQSIRDPLTNLYNRRYMEEALERELLAAERRGRPVGVILLDIDHFKQVNDVHGHSAGDALLREWGHYLREHSRGGDIACRFGGEEFLLILPDADRDQTRQRAEAHRRAFLALAGPHNAGLSAALTVSCGVALFPAHGPTAEALVAAADAALYAAKRAGRNGVAVAP